MSLSWKSLRAAVQDLVTAKHLTEENGQMLQNAAEADFTAESGTPPVAATTPVAPATTTPTATAAPAAAAPAAPAAPVAATTPVPVADDDVQKQLADAQAEIRRLKAAQTPGLAAAAAAGDIQQSGKPSATGEKNSHFENLKRIKAEYNRFGLTDEINLGSSQD